MAIPSTTAALFQIIDEWIALVSPIAARDPAAFWSNDINAAGAAARLRGFVTRFDDFTAINIINNELSGGTARLNRIFGTALSAPQFQSPILAPEAIQETFFPSPTPAQVAGFGPGVELSALEPALVEAAAILAPESFAARFLNQKPVPLDSPVVPPAGFIPTSLVSSQAETVGIAETFSELAARSGSGPAPPTSVPLDAPLPQAVMAIAPQEVFFSSETTGLPTSGGPAPAFTQPEIRAGLFSSILKGLVGGASGFLLGGPAGAAIGLGSAFLPSGAPSVGIPSFPTLPTPRFPPSTFGPSLQTPGFTGLPQFDQSAQLRAALQALRATGLSTGGAAVDVATQPFRSTFAPTAVPPSIPSSVAFPLNGGLATTGLPIAPVVQAQSSVCFRAPKGYVVVEIVGSDGVPVKVAMWKPLAKSLKLFKSRPRARITAAEWRTLKVANRVARKAAATAKEAGFSVSVSGRARKRPTTKRKQTVC